MEFISASGRRFNNYEEAMEDEKRFNTDVNAIMKEVLRTVKFVNDEYGIMNERIDSKDLLLDIINNNNNYNTCDYLLISPEANCRVINKFNEENGTKLPCLPGFYRYDINYPVWDCWVSFEHDWQEMRAKWGKFMKYLPVKIDKSKIKNSDDEEDDEE